MPVQVGSTHALFVSHIQRGLAKVTAIKDDGVILNRPRDIQDLDEIREVYGGGTPERINAWLIQRERMGIRRSGSPSSHELRIHFYLVRGYYELNDELASDDTFQQIITDIFNVFLPRRQKVDATDQPFFRDTEDVSARLITVRNLSGHWVHYCEIQFVFSEEITQIDYLGIGS